MITPTCINYSFSNQHECVITTQLESDAKDEPYYIYFILEGMQLDPKYMTTDRLYELLSNYYNSFNIKDFDTLLDEFVVDFIRLCRERQSLTARIASQS